MRNRVIEHKVETRREKKKKKKEKKEKNSWKQQDPLPSASRNSTTNSQWNEKRECNYEASYITDQTIDQYSNATEIQLIQSSVSLHVPRNWNDHWPTDFYRQFNPITSLWLGLASLLLSSLREGRVKTE